MFLFLHCFSTFTGLSLIVLNLAENLLALVILSMCSRHTTFYEAYKCDVPSENTLCSCSSPISTHHTMRDVTFTDCSVGRFTWLLECWMVYMAVPMFPPRPAVPEGNIETASHISQLQPPSRSEVVPYVLY